MTQSDTAAFYASEWTAAGDSAASGRRREADRVALAGLEPLEGRLTLEIAAGAGGNSAALASRGAHVVALDLTMASLERVRGLAPSCRLVCADAVALPFRHGAFDRVAIFSALMFLDAGRALGEMRRVLNSGGAMALVEPLVSNPFLRAWRAVRRKYAGMVRWMTHRELADHLAAHFPAATVECFYLLPGWTLLPRGIPRAAAHAIERGILAAVPAAARFGWIAVAVSRDENRAAAAHPSTRSARSG